MEEKHLASYNRRAGSSYFDDRAPQSDDLNQRLQLQVTSILTGQPLQYQQHPMQQFYHEAPCTVSTPSSPLLACSERRRQQSGSRAEDQRFQSLRQPPCHISVSRLQSGSLGNVAELAATNSSASPKSSKKSSSGGGLGLFTLRRIKSAKSSVASSGPVFLIFRDQVRRVQLPAKLTSVDSVKALFVRAFPHLMGTQWFEEDRQRRIYVQDKVCRQLFYELEDVRDVKPNCLLKIQEPQQQQQQQQHQQQTGQQIHQRSAGMSATVTPTAAAAACSLQQQQQMQQSSLHFNPHYLHHHFAPQQQQQQQQQQQHQQHQQSQWCHYQRQSTQLCTCHMQHHQLGSCALQYEDQQQQQQQQQQYFRHQHLHQQQVQMRQLSPQQHQIPDCHHQPCCCHRPHNQWRNSGGSASGMAHQRSHQHPAAVAAEQPSDSSQDSAFSPGKNVNGLLESETGCALSSSGLTLQSPVGLARSLRQLHRDVAECRQRVASLAHDSRTSREQFACQLAEFRARVQDSLQHISSSSIGGESTGEQRQPIGDSCREFAEQQAEISALIDSLESALATSTTEAAIDAEFVTCAEQRLSIVFAMLASQEGQLVQRIELPVSATVARRQQQIDSCSRLLSAARQSLADCRHRCNRLQETVRLLGQEISVDQLPRVSDSASIATAQQELVAEMIATAESLTMTSPDAAADAGESAAGDTCQQEGPSLSTAVGEGVTDKAEVTVTTTATTTCITTTVVSNPAVEATTYNDLTPQSHPQPQQQLSAPQAPCGGGNSQQAHQSRRRSKSSSNSSSASSTAAQPSASSSTAAAAVAGADRSPSHKVAFSDLVTASDGTTTTSSGSSTPMMSRRQSAACNSTSVPSYGSSSSSSNNNSADVRRRHIQQPGHQQHQHQQAQQQQAAVVWERQNPFNTPSLSAALVSEYKQQRSL